VTEPLPSARCEGRNQVEIWLQICNLTSVRLRPSAQEDES